MTCSYGIDGLCENAGDMGTSQECKADQNWCTKAKLESPINGYARTCGNIPPDWAPFDTLLKGTGYNIETMCFNAVRDHSSITSSKRWVGGVAK